MKPDLDIFYINPVGVCFHLSQDMDLDLEELSRAGTLYFDLGLMLDTIQRLFDCPRHAAVQRLCDVRGDMVYHDASGSFWPLMDYPRRTFSMTEAIQAFDWGNSLSC